MCRGVSSISDMRAEIETKRGHSIWAKHQRGSGVIDLGEVFKEYWGSTKHDFIVPSQSWSPTSSLTSDGEAQRTLWLENLAGL